MYAKVVPLEHNNKLEFMYITCNNFFGERVVGVDDSSTYRLGSVVATRPARTRDSWVRSLVWPSLSLPARVAMTICKGFSQQHKHCTVIQMWKNTITHASNNEVFISYDFGSVELNQNKVQRTRVTSLAAEGQFLMRWVRAEPGHTTVATFTGSESSGSRQ